MLHRLALVALKLALIAAPLHAQHWRDDDAVWGLGYLGGPRRIGPQLPDPPPIVPTTWLALEHADVRDLAVLVLPWILDPDRAPPVAGEGEWRTIESSTLPAVACAFTTVVVDADDVRMARLTGARWLVVDDSAHIGDPERRGDRGVPVALKKGVNRIFVVEATDGWELELWRPATRCVIGTWDVGWPPTTGDHWEIKFPVFNASTDPAEHVQVHSGACFVPTPDRPNVVDDWSGGGSIAALSIGYLGARWWNLDVERTPGRAGNRMPLVVYDEQDDEAAREMLCDLDASYERRRLHPVERELARAALCARPQARIRDGALLVYGTQGDAATKRALLARARLDQQAIWYACGDVPRILADTELVEPSSKPGQWRVQSWASSSHDPAPVVLYGDPATNAAWRPLRASYRAPSAGQRELEEDPSLGAGTDAWVQTRGRMPGNSAQRSVTAFASTGERGARLSLGLALLRSTPEFARLDPAAMAGFLVIDGPQ